MGETGIEKRRRSNSLDKVQYTLAFGIVGVLLYLIGFPIVLLFFFGLVGYFLWKLFAHDVRSDSRRIFEFYLRSNEILREDGRRWYGFEVREAIRQGTTIAAAMGSVPPLVDFCLGALYEKIGEHKQAIEHLEPLAATPDRDEANIIFPSKELREHVRLLRKIERAPAEAPLTTAALRSLERLRKNHADDLLLRAREAVEKPAGELSSPTDTSSMPDETSGYLEEPIPKESKGLATKEEKVSENGRKTISEVLHDIYDTNVH